MTLKVTEKANDSNYVQKTDVATKPAADTKLSDALSGKTDVDGKIGHSRQGGTGDCYLLAQLNGLSYNKYGSKELENILKPDGNGGLFVTLKGTRDGEKSYHITADEIINIREYQKNTEEEVEKKLVEEHKRLRESGEQDFEKLNKILSEKYGSEYNARYSQGDDDVLAVELAIEKYFKSIAPDLEDPLDGHVNPDEDIVRLLVGARNSKTVNGSEYYTLDKILQKGMGEKTAYIAFREGNKLGLRSKHAFTIKEVVTDKKGHKSLILVDTHDSSGEIKKDYYDAIFDCHLVLFNDLGKEQDADLANYSLFSCNSDDERKSVIEAAKKQKNEHVACEEEERKEALARQEQERQEALARQEQERLEKLQNTTNQIIDIIKNQSGKERIKSIQDFMQKTDAKEALVQNYEEIIKAADSAEWGWGFGQAKKDLIWTFVGKASAYARDHGANYARTEFEETCRNELEAWFYTDETVIIKAFKDLFGKIK